LSSNQIDEVVTKSKEIRHEAKGGSEKQQNPRETETSNQKVSDKGKTIADSTAAKTPLRRGTKKSEHNNGERQGTFDSTQRVWENIDLSYVERSSKQKKPRSISRRRKVLATNRPPEQSPNDAKVINSQQKAAGEQEQRQGRREKEIIAACHAEDLKFEGDVQTLCWNQGLPVELCDEILRLHSANETKIDAFRANRALGLLAQTASVGTSRQREPPESKRPVDIPRNYAVEVSVTSDVQPASKPPTSAPVVDDKAHTDQLIVEGEGEGEGTDVIEIIEEHGEASSSRRRSPRRSRTRRRRGSVSRRQEPAAVAASSASMRKTMRPV
jgi:hypothetical protein